MKKSLLIGVLLAIASSSVYAYQITSQKPTNTFGGSPNTTYYIKCNSGASTTVVSNPVSWTKTVYQLPNNGTQFASVDLAAKKGCGE